MNAQLSSLIEDLDKVRKHSPLVHNITNDVVMNNTANALLAIGASPVMAHAIEEVEDMVSIASALVLNIGTLDSSKVKAMLLAANKAKQLNTPIVFDPVGVGATAYRNTVAEQILQQCKPTIIRGNASEIMALAKVNTKTKGVDSTVSSDSAIDLAKQLAKSYACVVVVSGEIDYITDGKEILEVKNGHTLMQRVTGMGCSATALIGAFVAVNNDVLKAAYNAMVVMGIAGELAAANASGNGSMQVNFLDELYKIDQAIIKMYFKA
ncbi:hydroxyethylthiazole kinase [Myroides sp. BIT-d1]|uniref:Hydroxyethylthiazole kinase n=1 Tax=Myroides albus TaxID=2562892 RepID=A0A6I3LN53_9FLAO|nr:hydroxyethylthiazole kinase [Myroides albus]MTG98740.1 hydroxyethylthiazole kinase [Myroides albus]